MMNSIIQIIIHGVIFGCFVYVLYLVYFYRRLTVKLTKVINDMYCTEEGCTYLKYYTVPIDGKKGVMTDYCSIHLVEHVGNEAN